MLEPVPLSQRVAPLTNRKHRKDEIIMQPVKPSKSVEVEYRNALYSLNKRIRYETESTLNPVLEESGEVTLDVDPFERIKQVFRDLRNFFSVTLQPEYRKVAENLVEGANKDQKQRFDRSLNQALGADISWMASAEGLTKALEAEVRRNVALIETIPNQYFNELEKMVYQSVIIGSPNTTLEEDIKQKTQFKNKYKKLSQSLDSRAKVIARDQAQKINANLNQIRQESIGVTEYVWMTSTDERVRDSHRNNHNKRFRWDSPPPETGHPGNDIQCRCVAKAVLTL